MDQPSSRSKLVVPLVAVVSFVLGVVCGVVVMAVAWSGMSLRVWREFQQDTRQKVRADITQIREALDSYAMEHAGIYPASLDALVTPDERGHRCLSHTTVPKDPWDEEYAYEPPSAARPQPYVYTLGRDKTIGGTGDDEDIDYEAIVDGR
jgi:general secretion pathway protein G